MHIRYSEQYPPIRSYFDLFETTGWNNEYHVTEHELEQTLNASYYIVSAYDDDYLVGSGRVVSDGILHALIYELIVHPSYQRQGIGSAILKMLVQKCVVAGIRDVQLFSAAGKKHFYELHGFVARPADAPGMEYSAKPVDHREGGRQ